MKSIISLVLISMFSFQMQAQEWQTSKIEGYGKIKYFEDAAEQPDTTLNYKLVFDIKDGKEKEGVNVGLLKIARALNMLESGKISSEKIDIVAVVHGEATDLVLSNEKYQEKYKKSNPNIELLKLLKENGVKIFVCGQATAARNIAQEDMNESIELALSALSVLSNYQLRGYALIP
ncbi:DsrE/DsrF/DsrH-like protein [Gillisia sp. Hel_I_86]|uniref:DsrE family protein n=1 Tax=Gillisia sp. Hel_I_86 TaxID=1249981 RepID=UPI00119ACD22|nr:DsrE family protein [Gillisia sp. Hel_I_86]TVZ27145.1 DsrE/DsrF/DsrH-like protein [Gillisia sp. Hel_I_86]